MPRFGVEIVERFDQAASHQLCPQTIHDHASKPAVLRLRQQRRKLLLTVRSSPGGDLAEFRVQKSDRRRFARRLVTAMQLQRRVGKDGGQRVRIVQFPVVDKAVVTARAFQIRAEENLADRLSRLDFSPLTFVDGATPFDAERETLGTGSRHDQLADELVVGLVCQQRLVQPAGDLSPSAVDEAGPLIGVPQQIIPEGQPVIGVVAPIAEQTVNQRLSLVRRSVVDELVEFSRRRQHANEVEKCSTSEGAVGRQCLRI